MSTMPRPVGPAVARPPRATPPQRTTPAPPALAAAPPALELVEVKEHGLLRSLIDVLAAATLILLTLPALLVVSLLVVTTSRGPVFFRQRRVGQGGRIFRVVKFRTMYADAEERAAELFAQMDDGSGPLNKLRRDPRVTPVGRWLRRLSIDEMPQLWNVLTGSMALVGPRPTTPHEVARFAPGDLRRTAVRPGMTGLAQINGRSDLEWDEAVRLDLEYVEHRSAWLDLRILLRTVPAVFGGRGAY